MKKILPQFAKVLILVAFATVISCGDDDSEKNNNNADKIIGSWLYNGYTDSATGEYFEDDIDPCHSFTMTFNSNKKGTEVDKNCVSGDDTYGFTWEAKGNNVYIMTSDDDSEDIDILSVTFVSDTKITVLWEDSDPETFTKK